MTETPRILYEDNHLIAVSKPAGILSQGDSTDRESLLEILREYIRVKYAKPGNVFLGLVHRLDLPVTGTMVFARTSKAAQRLHKEFLGKRVEKFYLALVEKRKKLPEGWTLLKGYAERRGDKTYISSGPGSDRKDARLRFLKLFETNDRALLLVKLETGRKHQIRAQLSHEGFPVLGDRHYGSTESREKEIFLHACFLSFKHPVKDEVIRITDPLPAHFTDQLNETEDLEKKIIDSIEAQISG